MHPPRSPRHVGKCAQKTSWRHRSAARVVGCGQGLPLFVSSIMDLLRVRAAVMQTPVDWMTVLTFVNRYGEERAQGVAMAHLPSVRMWTLLHFAAWEQKAE
jgi:hypothetical protein